MKKNLLNDIKEYFGITSRILERPSKNNKFSRGFDISDSNIKQFYLENFNIPEGNKTYSVGCPSYFYNEDCAKAYVRGCFDGDGCITHLNRKSPTASILTASELFILSLKKIVENNIPNISIKYDNSKYYSLNFSGEDTFKLLDWMYSAEGLRLERKYEKYLKVKDIVCSTE